MVEAKKPLVNIKEDPGLLSISVGNAWNTRLPLCIQTDFEEFAVYDCPRKDQAGIQGVVFFRLEESRIASKGALAGDEELRQTLFLHQIITISLGLLSSLYQVQEIAIQYA